MKNIFERSKVKSENITIRVTPEQKAVIADRANTLGMTISEYILSLCGKDIYSNSQINKL